MSRPTGARGLKSESFIEFDTGALVASHRGAWIEIDVKVVKEAHDKSRPTGARGLKSAELNPLL